MADGPLSAEGQARPDRSLRIRVLIAEEPTMSCDMMKTALMHSSCGFDIVACATTQADLVRELSTSPIDVALVSENLVQGPFIGFQVLKQLKAKQPCTRLVLLMNRATRDLVIDAFRAGAEGIICRSEPMQSLYKCIESVYKGQVWANSDQLHYILEALITSSPQRVTNLKGECLLTEKEDEVGVLVAEGMTNREIALRLKISEHTVSNHLFRIYEKLGISTRVELALYVIRQNQR
jgi:DNA-binding NarL/FixJ family response regulator